MNSKTYIRYGQIIFIKQKTIAMPKRLLLSGILSLFTVFLFAQTEKIDEAMMQKIRNEGLNNSKVMDHAFYLTDVNGPRLANSPGYNNAGNWIISELKKWGLVNARMEPWGEFGKGWELKKSYLAMTAPYYRPLVAYPKAWVHGTGGAKSAEVLLIQATDSLQLQQYKGKLKGKILIVDRNDTLKPSFQPDARRWTEEQLTEMAERQPVQAGGNQRRFQGGRRPASVAALLKEMAESEKALAILSTSPRGRDGTLFVSGGGSYQAGAPENITDMMLSYEEYLSIVRLLRSGVPVKLDIEVAAVFHEKDTKGYNLIAEIPGSDPTLKDEIVMLGGHLDSWHGSTGATDNASGCVVMMEALRILKALDVKPRRTIRIALWGNEEQGIHGSRNYVKNTFGDPATMKLTGEHKKFSVYFNMDNGTGKYRGIYLQGNEAARPIFESWLKPFHDLEAKTITISNTGGTDHLSFDALGLPGFQFIQDPIEYSTRTHHTTMDSYDHLIAEDLMQNATITAAFIYNAAMRDEKMPRKALPEAR